MNTLMYAELVHGISQDSSRERFPYVTGDCHDKGAGAEAGGLSGVAGANAVGDMLLETQIELGTEICPHG
ncbi:MAG: hypothetical protein ACYDGY_04020 [Acidimicrobiales bacterium]